MSSQQGANKASREVFTPVSRHLLERLDVPGAGFLWRAAQEVMGPGARRCEFRRLVMEEYYSDKTFARMRTLIDLGLWDDFGDGYRQPNGLGGWAGRVMARMLHGPWADRWPGLLAMDEAKRMFCDHDGTGSVYTQNIPSQAMHLMIEAGLGVDGVDEHSIADHRRLAFMAGRGAHGLVLLLLRAGANARMQSWPNSTAAHLLAMDGSDDAMATLQEMVAMGVDINDPGQASDSRPEMASLPPISKAILQANPEAVRAMIGLGARVDWRGETALHVAARIEDQYEDRHRVVEVLGVLEQAGAMLDEAFVDGKTPLWVAAGRQPVVAMWLIEHGARVVFERDGRRQGLLDVLMEVKADPGQWRDVIDLVEMLDPACWSIACHDRVRNRGMSVGDRAMASGGAWAARAAKGSRAAMAQAVAPAQLEGSSHGPRL